MQVNKSNADVIPLIPGGIPAVRQPDAPEQTDAAFLRLRSGITALGKRCLSLEQELVEQAQPEDSVLLPPAIVIYYDTGEGYSETQKLLHMAEVSPEGEVFVTIQLPEDARAIRLDPGEQPCVITNLSFSDHRIIPVPSNGYRQSADCLLFTRDDPNISLTGKVVFPASEEIICHFRYEAVTCAPLCAAFNALNDQLEAHLAQAGLWQREVEAMRNSASWKLTAPIRALKRLLLRLFGGQGRA